MHWSYSKITSAQSSTSKKVSDPRQIWIFITSMFTRGRLLFGLISGTVFFFFTGFFFYLYEWEFLHETLLYHLTRTDPRHNFSIYFYHIYLHYEKEFSVSEKLVSFLPQVIVQLVLIFRFRKDLTFCFFLQTVAFVAFNKVFELEYRMKYPLIHEQKSYAYSDTKVSLCLIPSGHYSTVLCLVLLPIASHTAME